MGTLSKWWSGLSRRGHIITAVIVAVIVLLAIGTAVGPQNSAGPSASPTSVVSATLAPTAAPPATPTIAPTPTPTPIPATPAPTPSVLLTLKGNGIKNSAPFTASGDSVTVAYTFDCAAFGSQGNFIAELVDSTGSLNSIANALAANGKDTTTVYLANTTGPYHVEVNSECSWTVTVTGTP